MDVLTANCMRQKGNSTAAHLVYQPLNQLEVRLLRLQPASFGGPIYCTIAAWSLDKDLVYNALSYVWGDPTVRLPIKLNGQPITITKNLENALRHIRRRDTVQILWVDALCINQEDQCEINAQVQKMGRIYERAESVIIWLGPEDYLNSFANTAKVFEYMKKLARLAHEERSSIVRKLSFDDLQCLNMMVTLRASRLPLDKEYWERLWVVQEAALAKNLVVLNGRQSIPFDDIFKGISLALDIMPWGLNAHAKFISGLSRIGYYRNLRNNATPLPLSEILRDAHNLHCSEPRDKIYGLLGLADDGSDITPDYSLSIEDVYIKAAKHVASLGDLTLMAFFSGVNNKKHGLPSWVSDWTILDRTSPAPLTVGAGYSMYHASKHLTMDITFTNNDRIMVVKGTQVDNIDTYGFTMDIEESSHFDILSQWEAVILRRFGCDNGYNESLDKHKPMQSDSDMGMMLQIHKGRRANFVVSDILDHWYRRTTTGNSSSTGGYSKYRKDIVGDWSILPQTPHSLGTKAQRMECLRGTLPPLQKIYLTGENVAEAYIRVLLLDRDFTRDDRFDSDTLERFLDSNIPQADETEDKPEAYEYRRLRLCRENKDFDDLLRLAVSYRRLFITVKGYIGLGPSDMQKDDKVCLLFGSSVPFVMRQDGSTWRLIGDCYVHGIMDGEISNLLDSGELDCQMFDLC
ncbi:hypothetical protein OIDMADRAFT_181179 [Oidiodendron maius Zn]|uniref:Heterokaryon incompatibility domain-containing protein n=1 Tax=Oidiodendron maius (strain Zn) TaxID=913774 RepID=A0A0C3DCY4_OIDMZ|nr:hypothetical protein OIDMADRAFT_181179 [Oidiodendron maius Zn]